VSALGPVQIHKNILQLQGSAAGAHVWKSALFPDTIPAHVTDATQKGHLSGGLNQCDLGYTPPVRQCVAITLLLLTAFVVMADPLDCPDGCSNSDDQTTTQISSCCVDVCAWCLGVTVTYARPSLPVGPIVSEIIEIVPPLPLLGSPASIEHPPRFFLSPTN
jgi:hypothetical protein